MDEILADIEALAGPYRGPYLSFGRQVNEQDLERVFERLLLRDVPPTDRHGTIRLFQRNYLPGDHAVLQAALLVSADHGVTHGIAFALLDVAGSQPDPELAPCVEWVYEHTPCVNCRWQAVKELLARKRALHWLLGEAAWDCADDSRELVRKSLAAKKCSVQRDCP